MPIYVIWFITASEGKALCMKFIFLALFSLSLTDFTVPDPPLPRDAPGVSTTNLAETSESREPAEPAEPLLILTYGLPAGGPPAMARRDIARKFGFGYYAVAGCVVTEHLLDSVKLVNRRTIATIGLLQGKDWEQRFEKEVATLTTLYSRAIKLAEADPRIVSKTRELEKHQEYLSLDPVEVISNDIVVVEAYSFRWKQDKAQKVVYVRMKVDTKQSTVLITEQVEQVHEL